MEENNETNQELNDSNIDLGDSYLHNCVTAATRHQYSQKFKHFKYWVQHVYPEYVVDDRVVLEGFPTETMKEFLGHISKKRIFKDETPSNPIIYKTLLEYPSLQHINGYRSAIVFEYKKNGIRVTEDMTRLFEGVLSGYKRIVADKKQNGEMAMGEGKQPLSFTGYRYIANVALTAKREIGAAMFAHVFLILCWNLMARCHSVSCLMFEHISWEQDSMIIVFPQHKGDKWGKDAIPKHLYANPTMPVICPILALAVYLFSSGMRRIESKRTVFGGDGNAVERRFSKWLKALCGEHIAALLVLGIMILDIGTHSLRKGVATFLSGLIAGPTAIAIYIRAGWSLLGPVQSRYILESGGNDQLCGRAATGLTLTKPEFATLPAHFNMTDGSILSIEEWEQILPGYTSFYPSNSRPVVPFLLAAIIHHGEFLESNLHHEHPLFISPVWASGVLDRLINHVHTGIGRNTTIQMVATGIPPHILLANQMVKIEASIANLRHDIMGKLEQLPEEIKTTMLNNFAIGGVVPITQAEVQCMLTTLQISILEAIQQYTYRTCYRFFYIHSYMGKWLSCCSRRLSISKVSIYVLLYVLIIYLIFIIIRCSISLLWNLWWSGKVSPIPALGHGPYRMLTSADMFHKEDKVNLSKARKGISIFWKRRYTNTGKSNE